MKALGAILFPVSAHVSCCLPCVYSSNELWGYGSACQENEPGGNYILLLSDYIVVCYAFPFVARTSI